MGFIFGLKRNLNKLIGLILKIMESKIYYNIFI